MGKEKGRRRKIVLGNSRLPMSNGSQRTVMEGKWKKGKWKWKWKWKSATRRRKKLERN